MLNNKIKHNGFSLVELMVVIGIIAIIAAIAMPIYSTYQKDAMLTEADSIARPYILEVQEFVNVNDRMPNESDKSFNLNKCQAVENSKVVKEICYEKPNFLADTIVVKIYIQDSLYDSNTPITYDYLISIKND